MKPKTENPAGMNEQEQFWAGEFGIEYQKRNQGEDLVAAKTAAFAHVLWRAGAVKSVLEFGANIGLNIVALRRLLPTARFAAIEINALAVDRLKSLGGVDVTHGSVIGFTPKSTYDLVLSAGLLIHIAPEKLPDVYDALYKSSGRYVVLMEYYNPTPVEVEYRGHRGKLFKRDFAGDLLARFPDVKLVDYGFVYHRQPNFPIGDGTWFLLEKR